MRSRFQLVLSSASVNSFLVRFLLIDCDYVYLKPFDVSKRQLSCMVAEQHFALNCECLGHGGSFSRRVCEVDEEHREQVRRGGAQSERARNGTRCQNLQAVRKEITEHAEGVVDQAAAKFTQLEMQTREQRELASSITQAAKVEFRDCKASH